MTTLKIQKLKERQVIKISNLDENGCGIVTLVFKPIKQKDDTNWEIFGIPSCE